MKICTKCKIEKSDNYFSSSRFEKSSGWCKLCVKEYNKQYLQEHKEEILEKKKQLYQYNKEDILKYQQHYQNNIDGVNRTRHQKNGYSNVS